MLGSLRATVRTAAPRWRPAASATVRAKSALAEDARSESSEPPELPVSFEDISTAMFRIRDGVVRTDCKHSHFLSDHCGADVYIKKEFTQFTGSFKERGARNALMLLGREERKRGVIAASAGNHALALAWHGKQMGIPVTVVMPKIAPMTKVNKCRQFGANIVSYGAHILESKEHAHTDPEFAGMKYINGYDDPEIIAGAGTIGIEILEQVRNLPRRSQKNPGKAQMFKELPRSPRKIWERPKCSGASAQSQKNVPNVDAVVVPVGGAGLIAGIALAVKTLRPDVQIIGVEPLFCASLTAALKAGYPVAADVTPTLADGLAVPVVGGNAYKVSERHVDKVVCVDEKSIALSVLRLVEMEKYVVEGGGAAGLAALLPGGALDVPELKGKKIVVPLCGGNIDVPVLGRVIDRGLAADFRLVRFVCNVSDRPGGIADLTRAISDCGASIRDIYHERAWLHTNIDHVQIKVVVEIAGKEHKDKLHAHLEDQGYIVLWGKDASASW